jgi:anoctamin-10
MLRGYILTIADQSQAIGQLEKLLQSLAEVGLQAEVRQGDETSLLVFVKASEKRLKRAVYRSRLVMMSFLKLRQC